MGERCLADDLVAGGLGDDAQLGLRAAASLARLLRDQSRPGDPEIGKTLLDALGHAQ